MDNSQKRIFEWLKEQDECLGELYEAAVRMVEDDSFPGRKRLICHAVREIRNRLPEMVGTKGIRQRVDYPKEVGQLATLWENEGVQSVYQKDKNNCEPVTGYRVSEKFLKQVERIVQGHMGVGGRKEHNAKQLLMALETENRKWEGTLSPVVKQWLDVTEWFVVRVHVGRVIDDEKLIGHFERFENVLLSLVGYFYEGMDKIKETVELANSSDAMPSADEVAKVVAFLGRSNYRIYFFKELKNPHWLKPLIKHGFFGVPDDPQKGKEYDRWLEGWYLNAISESVPEKVLDVIKNVKCENPYVRSDCIKCLLKMPLETAAKGNKVIGNILKRDVDWLWIGQNCAKLMVKMLDKFPKPAFVVAWALLDAWVSEEKTYGKDIVAKFSGHDYRELMLEHFSKVWEDKPEEAIGVLITILNRCLENLDKEGKGEKGYDASRYFGYGLELGDLDKIDMKHPRIKTVLVKGICEAGKVLINEGPGKISKLLGWFEGTNRVIFLRIAMHLLRFVKSGTESARISKFIGDEKYYLNGEPYWNEHRRLLNDKFDDVSDGAKKVFLEWVDEDKYSEDLRKEITETCNREGKEVPNFEKENNRERAKELYLVRERFKDEYKGYKEAAEVINDSTLAPRKMVGETRWVSPMEGTSLTAEDMAKMDCEDVLDYILEPKNYEGVEKVSGWGTVKDALAATFKNDVKKRLGDYLDCDLEKLVALGPDFLASLFYGFREVEKIEREVWGQALELASKVIKNNAMDEKYRACYSATLSALRDGFSSKEDEGIEFTEDRVKEFWGIIETLTRYPVGDISQSSDYERDPMQMGCVLVPAQAMELSVSLGIVCKKYFPELHESYLKGEIQECYEKVLKIKEEGINYNFGSNFTRIYWTDTEWVKENLSNIFSEELWDETWGTYVSWGRPSPQCFELLVEEQQYLKAVKRIGEPSKFKFGKDPDKGLTEHLMIGYFNEWINYDHEVLQEFFKKAPAVLRAKAARFLASGFKDVNEKGGGEKEEVAARMKLYWESRLAVMDKDEVIGFIKWMSDSVLDGKETLEFVEKTLKISGGKLSKHGDTKGFVEGVCKFGKEGNELLALRCFKEAAADENMHMTWSRIQEPLVNFLVAMVDMPQEVRSAAIEVADAYGRYNPDEFRGVWAKLNEKN